MGDQVASSDLTVTSCSTRHVNGYMHSIGFHVSNCLKASSNQANNVVKASGRVQMVLAG
jgi:hypothetical protein